jgi:hypothetical protein
VDVQHAELGVRRVAEAVGDAGRRCHEASGAGPEHLVADDELGLTGEHVEGVDEVVVGVDVDALEVGAEAQLDDLELRQLAEDPVVPVRARECSPPSGPSATIPSTGQVCTGRRRHDVAVIADDERDG